MGYVDRRRLPESGEKELDLTYHGDGVHASVKEMGQHRDVVTSNCRLHPGAELTFDTDRRSSMRRGACIVNPARGELGVREDVAAALEGGQLARYWGDVWLPRPTVIGRNLIASIIEVGLPKPRGRSSRAS